MVKKRFAGIGGRLSLVALLSMGLLDQRLELLACVERDHAPRRDGNFFAGLGVAPGPLRLVAQLKVAPMSFASRLFSPTFSKSMSASSAFVSVICAPLEGRIPLHFIT